MRRPKLVNFVNYFFLLIFLLCVAVQYNDLDPFRWIAIYGAALICCILFAARKLPLYLSAGVGLAALIWAVFILPEVWGQTIPMHEVLQPCICSVQESKNSVRWVAFS